MATATELSDRYLEMSRKRIRQAQEELEQGDLAQASEKAWGAVAEALKAVGISRGWNHKSHPLLDDIVSQLSLEFGRPPLIDLFDSAQALHNNFYEHRFDRYRVQHRIDRCLELIAGLDNILNTAPRRFTPATREQERRLERLTRFDPAAAAAADAALNIADLPPVEPEG